MSTQLPPTTPDTFPTPLVRTHDGEAATVRARVAPADGNAVLPDIPETAAGAP